MTPTAEALLDGVPGSQRAMALMTGEEHYSMSWSELLYCVQTGKIGFEKLYGMRPFDFLSSTHPEQGGDLRRGHDQRSRERVSRGSRRLLDFLDDQTAGRRGVGNGSLISATLEKHHALRGILFDLGSAVIERSVRKTSNEPG